ncbi:hypothetical protein D3C80_1153730 [compost metagenome]
MLTGRLRAAGRMADPRLLDHQRIDECQDQAEDRHAGEGPAPAQVLGENAAEGHAQHRAEHAAGHEGAGECRAHALGEHREHHGDADAAIGGLPYADEEPGHEHVLVVFRQAAAQGRQAPEHGHQRQALDPAEAVGQQRQGEGEQADHQGDDAAEQAELGVAQDPFGLEQWKYGVEYLPRHVVGNQQAERQGEYHPGVVAGDIDGRIIEIGGGCGVESHGYTRGLCVLLLLSR